MRAPSFATWPARYVGCRSRRVVVVDRELGEVEVTRRGDGELGNSRWRGTEIETSGSCRSRPHALVLAAVGMSHVYARAAAAFAAVHAATGMAASRRRLVVVGLSGVAQFSLGVELRKRRGLQMT